MTIVYDERHEETLHRVELEFSRLIRTAIERKKFGQFGVIVSVQAGVIKTFQKHDVETLR